MHAFGPCAASVPVCPVEYPMLTKECCLYLDTPPGVASDGQSQEAVDRPLVVFWKGWDVPEGAVALENRLRTELPVLRDEHAAWAYDLGRLRVAGREVQHWLQGGTSLSMWWCSLLYERHPKMTPGLYTVYKIRTLERLLDAMGCTCLRVWGGDSDCRRALAQLCRASHRTFVEEDASSPGRKESSRWRRLYMAFPAPLRALARYVHWWWTVRRRLRPLGRRAVLPETVGPAATIATYFPNVDMDAAKQGRFRSRYWESLHDLCNRRARAEGGHFVRWLFIRFPSPQLRLEECIALRDRFRAAGVDGASFHYLEEFLGWRDVVAAWGRYVRLAFRSWRLARRVRPSFRFADSRWNFWPMLGDYWAESFAGWRCLERCLQHRAFQRYVAMAGSQRWTLFPLENCPWERMLTQCVHEAQHGPVMGAQHSIIRPTDFRYFDDPRTFTGETALFQPDAVWGNGQAAVSQWREASVPEARLAVVEALRYQYLNTMPSPGAGSTAAPQSLLVVTSFFRDETTAHLTLLAQALQQGLLDGWEVRCKPHPYLPVQDILRSLMGKQAAGIALVEGSIAQYLLPGVVVWASNSTTVALEAAVRALPVMVMLPVDDFDLCPLQDVPHMPRTGTLQDVARFLRHPIPVSLPRDYLELESALPRWKERLHL